MKTASRKIEFQLGHRSRGGVRGAGLALATAALAAVGFVVRIPALAESKGSGAGAWLPAAPMLQGRESFTATALKNGKVLVAGTAFGTPEGPGDPTKTALLYDPVKNAWTQTAPMITPRTIHSAALLADGRVLVAGGGGISGFLNTAEIYDPSTEKWSQAGTIGQGGRHWHTATLLNNGKVLVTGGRDQSHATSYTDAWLYEPKSNNWTATGSFEVGRRSHTATLLSDGAVLITGGQLSGHDPSLKDALIYDPGAGVFKPVPSLMNEGRATHTATMLPGGKVLLAGGKNQLVGGGPASSLASIEIYDPKAQTFTLGQAMATPRYAHAATVLSGGKALAVGGNGGGTVGNAKNVPLFTAESYDPVTEKWRPAGTLKPVATKEGDPLAYEAAVVLSQKPCGQNCGKVLALGSDSAQLFTPTAATAPASKQSSLPLAPLAGGVVVVLLGALVLIWRSRRN